MTQRSPTVPGPNRCALQTDDIFVKTILRSPASSDLARSVQGPLALHAQPLLDSGQATSLAVQLYSIGSENAML